jgi:hypothetical protein
MRNYPVEAQPPHENARLNAPRVFDRRHRLAAAVFS